MNNSKKLIKKKKIKETFINNDWFVKLYSYFHIFITFVALVIFYTCSKKEGKFNKRTFLFAICWPHFYLIHIYTTIGFKFCFSSGGEEEDDSSDSSE